MLKACPGIYFEILLGALQLLKVSLLEYHMSCCQSTIMKKRFTNLLRMIMRIAGIMLGLKKKLVSHTLVTNRTELRTLGYLGAE